MAKSTPSLSKTTNISPKEVFARHETFHPRFGWLKKGFDRASTNPHLFLQEDAPLQLGVGKNMVKSIRYWCAAFKILAEDCPIPGLSADLLAADGWDPYLEDPASLWLLHWALLQPPCLASTWAFTFNQFRAIDFSGDGLLQELQSYRDSIAPRIADSSLRKDIQCLLRMYVKQPTKSLGKGSVGEDSLDCPFADLGLIQALGDDRRYRFNLGAKANLPAEVIVYGCLAYGQGLGAEVRSIPITKLIYDINSPGLIFKLTESSIIEAITQVSSHFQSLGLEDLAGKFQFTYDRPPLALGKDILTHYFSPRL